MQISVDTVYSMVTIYMQINVLEDQEEDIFLSLGQKYKKNLTMMIR